MPITSTTVLSSLTSEDIAPYREQYATWRRVNGVEQARIDRDWATVLAGPASLEWHLGSFRTWLLEQEGILPTSPDAADVPDGRRALGEALATMRRRERDAKADAHQARLDLVTARQEAITARETAALPFNAQHPGWYDFWLEAARNATRSGHCPEYDRHAELMGGITRDAFRADGVSLHSRERVTYTVTLSFTYSTEVEAGEDAEITEYEMSSIGRLAYDHRYDLNDYSVEEEERESLDED